MPSLYTCVQLERNDLSATAIGKLRSKYGKRKKIQREHRKRNFERDQVDILDPPFGFELFVKLEFVSVSGTRIFMKMYILCINVNVQNYRIVVRGIFFSEKDTFVV